MTEEQFKEKITEMANNSKSYLETEAIRLFHSGAVDARDYEDDYLLPKLILSVALENEAREYRPFSVRDHRKELANLKHF